MLFVNLTVELGESPFARDDDQLTARELELGTTEGFEGMLDVLVTDTTGEEDISDGNTGDETLRLTEGTTHTGLETISTGAGQHFVDTDDVVGMLADTHVETFLTAGFDHVFVGANTGSFQSLK